jgi:hypothetical protein
MATARAMLERRRSSRIPTRIPVKLFTGTPHEKSQSHAETISVSRYGALLRAPISPEVGTRIDILHEVSNEIRAFRVICAKNPGAAAQAMKNQESLFEVGVEILYPMRNFWGVEFPDETLHPATVTASSETSAP